MLLLVLVDVVANLISGGSARPWSLPLLVGIVVLLVAVTVWQYLMEHPGTPKRAWTSGRSPYPGLEAFTEQDAVVFFGREPQITELVDRLHPILPRNAHRFVAVVGPSGVGKSSLVQAGLLPRLAGRRGRWVIVPPLLPGDHPTRSLADSLGVPEADLADALRAAGGGRTTSVLVVIDQAEELLTLTGAKERDAFLELLCDALAQDPRLWVVATLRSEFLTGFLETDFADLFQHPLAIGTLGRAALSAVIEGPAAQAGPSAVKSGSSCTVTRTRSGAWLGHRTASAWRLPQRTVPSGCGTPSAARRGSFCAATKTGSGPRPGRWTASGLRPPHTTAQPGYRTPLVVSSGSSCAAIKTWFTAWRGRRTARTSQLPHATVPPGCGRRPW